MRDHITTDPKSTMTVAGVRHGEGAVRHSEERLAVEAPLQIRVNGDTFTTTMRTPGADESLARGLLYTEGIVIRTDIAPEYRTVDDPESGFPSVMDVIVDAAFVEGTVEGRRTMLASAACGVCGTRELADLEVYGPPLRMPESGIVGIDDVVRMRESMRSRQELFAESGGTHAAAVFDVAGNAIALYEDVGRHNAVDKCVGALLNERRLENGVVLFVSGRVSYEIVYKAYRAALPILCAVSAPTSLAVETATRLGITLAGFCRDDRATVYSHAARFGGNIAVES